MGPLRARSLAVPTQVLKRPSSMHGFTSDTEAPADAARVLSSWSLSPGPPSAGWFVNRASLNAQKAFGE